jgi:OmpA-OmpF porin, OOP family
MIQALLAALLCVAAPTMTLAQSKTTVLKGTEITEQALIEALAPVDTLPPGVRTRGLKLGAGVSDKPATETEHKPRSKDVLITFVTNSVQLDADGKAALDRVARAFNSEQLATLKFAIEGHADPRGSVEENMRLSRARADSVRNYLVAAKGVSADRLQAIGKGDRELLNTRQLTAPENRRVTFVTTTQ